MVASFYTCSIHLLQNYQDFRQTGDEEEEEEEVAEGERKRLWVSSVPAA